MVHEVEVETAPELQEEELETVSINSLYLNKNCSLITAHLETQVGKTTIEVPYKIDTGSEGNLMPLYIFKRLFKDMPEEQLKCSVKSNIKLGTYNGTHITQLGTCAVIIKFKSLKKCVFFVVAGNSQVLLGMPDTAALNMINFNMDSIQAGQIAEMSYMQTYKAYWSYRDELALIDGILLKGKCIIMPNSLKEQVLN